jgi:uncharacterized sulfatase
VPKGDKSSWHIAGKFWGKGKEKDGGQAILSRIVDIGGREDQIADYKKKGSGPGALMYASVDGPDNLLNDGKTAEAVIDFIKNKRDKSKPFMISGGFSRPHMPWVAPKKYFDMYPENAGTIASFPEGAKEATDMGQYKSKTRNGKWNEGVDDNTAKKLIRGYMASTTYADAQMGKIITALKEEDLYDNTIIIVWGDHGYHLTEHGLWRKNTPFHISLRNPMMIKIPNGQGGKVVRDIVQNIDIYPTILELTGTRKPENIKLHGDSLVPLLMGDKANGENIAHTSAKGSHGVVTDKYRFTVFQDGSYELYDLEQDPDEWHNLANTPKHKDLIKAFKQKVSQVVWNELE